MVPGEEVRVNMDWVRVMGLEEEAGGPKWVGSEIVLHMSRQGGAFLGKQRICRGRRTRLSEPQHESLDSHIRHMP